eukprot:scaffold70018_cov75-Phaeocystis_antarctica.AAC.1
MTPAAMRVKPGRRSSSLTPPCIPASSATGSSRSGCDAGETSSSKGASSSAPRPAVVRQRVRPGSAAARRPSAVEANGDTSA